MASVFPPTKGTSRNTRVCRLLVDLCPCLLRDILRHDIPESQFKSKLRRKEGVLRNKLLNKDQCDLLFPAPGQYYNNDYSEFDSALLYILIRTLCSYKAHKRGWGAEPRAQDVSVSACVERIRIARNKYVGHMSRFDMDGPTFRSIWAEIKRVVVELENVLSPTEKSIDSNTSYEIDMDKLETDPLYPEMEQFYKEKIEQQAKVFNEEREKANHVRRNILANTRSRLTNHSNNGYTATKAAQAITVKLKSKSIAIVAGCPGSGKTTTVLEVMNNIANQSNELYTPVILDNPEHWDQVVNISERMVIFIDDPMGKSNFDILNFVKWEQKFENMISCSTDGKCNIVISIRETVLQEMNDVCRPNGIFTHRNTINISKGEFKLDNNEKLQIIEQYQVTNNRELSDKDKTFISKSQPYYGFPQTCFLFFTNESLFELGVSFFYRPDKTLVKEIENLRKSDKRAKKLQYYILVYVLVYRTINMVYNADDVVAKICNLANLREVEPLECKDIIEKLDDIYLIPKHNSNKEFMFRHQTIKEAVLISHFKVDPKMVIKNCRFEDLGELIRTETHPTKDQEVVLIVAKSEYQDIVDRFMSFDPTCVELLECCVFNEWIGILQILFENDETLLNRTDDYGMTLITYAALWKRKKLVKYLYANNANVKHVNKFGSCLHFCVLNEWTDLLDIFFNDDHTFVNHTNAYSVTLIEYAAKHNQKDMVLYLYNYKAKITNVLQTPNMFLKYCVDNNWYYILSVILETDKELVSVEVTPGHSMITYAASQKKLESVKQLLDIIEHPLSMFDLNYLLQLCVDNDWCELLKTVFKDRSSLVNAKNKNNITLLGHAAGCDNKHMVEFLLKNGAEPNSISFLENCIENKWFDVLEAVLTKAPSLVDYNISSIFLYVCVDNELLELIETILIQQPTLVNFKNPDGETLIWYAAKKERKDIVLLLLFHDALIEQDNSSCKSLIQLCANNKWNDVLELLLKKTSCVVDINSEFGSTIFASETSEEMVMFLYKYIPRGSLSHIYVQMLFQNFVLQKRFQALELLMLDFPACNLENVFDFFENIPDYIKSEEIDTTSWNLYGMPGKTDIKISVTDKRISDDLIYKVLCIDQRLVEYKTTSPTFRYCLDKRPQIIISYMKKNNIDLIFCNWNIYSDSVILNAAFFGEKKLVLSLIDKWAKKTETTKDSMVKLMRLCIYYKWEDIVEIMMNIEKTFKPFLDNSVVCLINLAAEEGLTNVVNTLYNYTVKKTDSRYELIRYFSKDVREILINNNTELHSKLFLCMCVENELTNEIDRILSQQPNLINSTNPFGETLICYAAKTKKKNIVMIFLRHNASTYLDKKAGITFIKSCAKNEWNDIFKIIFKKTPHLFEINGIFGSLIFASNTPEQIVVFLYKLIPFGNILYDNVKRLFRNFVLEMRFHALELLMQDYRECTIFEDVLNSLDNIPDNVVYKILCIDERLVEDETTSSTFRYYLEKRPQIVLIFIENHQNAWNWQIDYESVILKAAMCRQKTIVSCMISKWATATGTTTSDMIKLLRICIDNQWEDIIQTMMRMEVTFKPFIGDCSVAVMIHAAQKGNIALSNTLFEYTFEMKGVTDKHRFFKKKVNDGNCEMLSSLLKYHCKPEYIQNDTGESLFLYATACGNRQVVKTLLETIDFKDYLGLDIENVLQNCIENDWGDIILSLLPKTYKLVTNRKLSKIFDYALSNNKRELIASLLEYQIDFTMTKLLCKHCVDYGWCDILQLCLSEDNRLVDVLYFDGVPIVNYAARYGMETVMKHLYLSNTSTIKVCHFDTYGHTSIHYCIAKGWTFLVGMIVSKMPISIARTQYGVGCIHIAAFFGRMGLVTLLESKGQKLSERTCFGLNAFQMTLLGLRYVSKQSLKFPFRDKCRYFCMDIHEKELLSVKTFDSSSSHKYEALITYISLKPKFQVHDLDFAIDKYGNSILYYLVTNDNQSLVNWVLEREDNLKLIINNGKELGSVLHLAAYLGRSSLFKTFLDCDVGAICDNDSLIDSVKAGCKFAGQAVYNSPSGWINQDRIFMYDMKIKAVKYVELQFGKDEEFDTIIKDSLAVRL